MDYCVPVEPAEEAFLRNLVNFLSKTPAATTFCLRDLAEPVCLSLAFELFRSTAADSCLALTRCLCRGSKPSDGAANQCKLSTDLLANRKDIHSLIGEYLSIWFISVLCK